MASVLRSTEIHPFEFRFVLPCGSCITVSSASLRVRAFSLYYSPFLESIEYRLQERGFLLYLPVPGVALTRCQKRYHRGQTKVSEKLPHRGGGGPAGPQPDQPNVRRYGRCPYEGRSAIATRCATGTHPWSLCEERTYFSPGSSSLHSKVPKGWPPG